MLAVVREAAAAAATPTRDGDGIALTHLTAEDPAESAAWRRGEANALGGPQREAVQRPPKPPKKNNKRVGEREHQLMRQSVPNTVVLQLFLYASTVRQ